MPKKPTSADAELILKLYHLRREPELRKARNWWVASFWPSSIDDYMKVSSAMGTQENNWLRQVTGYWEMASSLVNHGVISPDLFLEPSFSAEMFLIYSKMRPFIKELRQSSPTFLINVEKVVNSSKKSREFQQRMEKNLTARRQAMSAAKAG